MKTPTKTDRRVMKRLLEDLDGDLLFGQQEELPLSNYERFKRQDLATLAIRSKHGQDGVFPYFTSFDMDRVGKVAVLHPAPTKADMRSHVVGCGAAPSQIREGLRTRGIPLNRINEVPAVFKHIGGLPTYDELEHGLVLQCLHACDVNFVLLHGIQSLRCWRQDVVLSQVAGKVGLWDNRWWVVPIYSADSTLGKYGGITRDEWGQHLAAFVELVYHPDPMKLVSDRCIARTGVGGWGDGAVLCGAHAYAWDRDALPWCEKHWERGYMGSLEGSRRRTRRRKEMKGQGTLWEET